MSPRRRAGFAVVANALVLAPAWAIAPSPMAAHVGVLAVLLSAFAGVEAACAEADDWCDRTLPGGPTLTALVLLAIFVLALATSAPVVSSVFAAVGVSVFGAGLSLRAWAMRTLGDDFVSQTRPCPQGARVRHGPYRWLRHPSEVGLLALAFGAGLTTASGPALAVAALVLTPIVALRTRTESREMDGVFR